MRLFNRDLYRMMQAMDRKTDLLIRNVNLLLFEVDRVRDAVQQSGVQTMASFDDLKAKVQQTTDAEEAAIVMLRGLRQQLADANAKNDPAAIQALIDQLDAATPALAAALKEGT